MLGLILFLLYPMALNAISVGKSTNSLAGSGNDGEFPDKTQPRADSS